jgi:hypothetical protein
MVTGIGTDIVIGVGAIDMRADITAIAAASIQKEIAAMNASSNVSESRSSRVDPLVAAAAVLRAFAV